MKSKSLQLKPYMLNKEPKRFQSLGAGVCVKANSEQTGGAFNLFDVICPVGFATPLHIHYAEDIAIFVLSGALTLFFGDKREAGVGSYWFEPKGTPHGFRVKSNVPARILYLTVPAGFDEFVIERGFTNKSSCMRAAARFKIEILGALPD